jgi:hypothetical protein
MVTLLVLQLSTIVQPSGQKSDTRRSTICTNLTNDPNVKLLQKVPKEYPTSEPTKQPNTPREKLRAKILIRLIN